MSGGQLSWAVVVLSWNDRENTLRCLRSLRELETAVSVICVDNGSSDGSADAIRSAHPEVRLIENATNLGFAGGANAGIRNAIEDGTDWVVLLNNDAVPAAHAIDAFDQAAREHPAAGVLSGKLYMGDPPSQRLWFAGARAHPGLGYAGKPRGWGKPDGERYDRLEPTGRAAGAFMAVAAGVVERVGGFDEGLFAYVEDVDYSVRVRQAGFEVLFVPEAKAWHRVSASTGGELSSTHSVYYGCRNSILVAERHRPLPFPLRSARRLFILAVFAAHGLRRSNREEALAAVWDGYRDAGRGRRGEWSRS